MPMHMTRRDALKTGGLGLLGLAALGTPLGQGVAARDASSLSDRNFPRRYVRPLPTPPQATPAKWVNGVPHYDITARGNDVEIIPGLSTRVYGYDGLVPGPTIHADRGTEAVVLMRNHLPAKHDLHGHDFKLSTHLHGSASLPEYDGYASDLTAPGYMKEYRYPNAQPARSMWYHDHAEHVTAKNVYSGLAAFYLLHDPWERENLPQGEFDVPLVVSDAMFARSGKLAYDDESHSGLWGDVILVNGVPWPVMQVKRRVYRFRILAATLARSFTFRLSSGHDVYIVGTDGGIMPNAVPVRSWRHSGAERYEVLIDFSRYNPGTRIELRNSSNDNNRDYDHTNKIMAFDVVDESFDRNDRTWNLIPGALVPSEVMDLQQTRGMKQREFRLHRSGGQWLIGNDTWHDIVESGYRRVLANPGLGDTEVWTLRNSSGGWFHPTHLHLVDFKILSRNGRAPFPYEAGPKDTVYLGEGEEVKIIMHFGPHRGRYMVHCHNLPHEDHDMMSHYTVGLDSIDNDPHDPVKAAPPVVDPTYPA